MNAPRLIWAFVRERPLGWAFNLLSLALGVAVVTALLAINSGIDARFERDLAGVDMVVGAKGSPLQIILSALFELDTPTGNIPLAAVQRLQHNMMVKRAVPVSLGDNYLGYRIVGTSPAFGDLYQSKLATGRWWTRPLEAVLGSEVARESGLKPGAVFVGEHGLARGGERHDHSPYRVTGILEPTGAVIDRLVLTDTASVWKVHEHENAEHAAAVASITTEGHDTYPAVGQEVTAVLIQYRSAMGALMMPRLIKADPALQGAVPALEVARLTKLLGTGSDVLRGFGIGLLGLSALGFFVSLLGAVQARQKSLALLRALGARPALLTGLVLGEGALLGLLGGVAGIALGRIAAIVAARVTAEAGGPALILPSPGWPDLALIGAATGLALVAALIPAIIAYRLEPARVLRS